jgi:hypothetical protein
MTRVLFLCALTACGGTIDYSTDAEVAPENLPEASPSADATSDAALDVAPEAEACRVIYGTWCRNDSGGPSDAAGCWFWYPADAGCGDQQLGIGPDDSTQKNMMTAATPVPT